MWEILQADVTYIVSPCGHHFKHSLSLFFSPSLRLYDTPLLPLEELKQTSLSPPYPSSSSNSPLSVLHTFLHILLPFHIRSIFLYSFKSVLILPNLPSLYMHTLCVFVMSSYSVLILATLVHYWDFWVIIWSYSNLYTWQDLLISLQLSVAVSFILSFLQGLQLTVVFCYWCRNLD